MSFLDEVWWMLVGHALADYVWQSELMGQQKNPWKAKDGVLGPWWWSMGAHSLVNGGMVSLVTFSTGLGVAEMGVHFLMDTVKCWVVARQPQWTKGITWIDQGIHLLSKGLWAWLS